MASLFSSPNIPALPAQTSKQNPCDPSHHLSIPSHLRPQLGHRLPTRPCRPPHLHASPSPSASTASAAALPINADYLSREFGGYGASFTALGDGRCAVRLGLDSGSTAGVLLPSGLVTSYKAQMWHGAAVEVLQTVVKQEGGEVVVRGGVSLGLRVAGGGREGEEEEGQGNGGSSNHGWSPTVWGLLGVRGSPEGCVQVELISVDPAGTAEVTYVVTLDQAVLGLELLVTNLTPSPLHLTGSMVGHLKVSTPDATYAVGLEGSSYRSYKTPPEQMLLPGSASISPPEFGLRRTRKKVKKEQGLAFFGWGAKGAEVEDDYEDDEEAGMNQPEEEEVDNNLQLSREVCRVYKYAPRRFTIIDRGRRNSVDLERRGFEELYMLSPGSDHEPYGEEAYVAVGAAAVLRPIVLGPGEVWSGGQYLYNPNM